MLFLWHSSLRLVAACNKGLNVLNISAIASSKARFHLFFSLKCIFYEKITPIFINAAYEKYSLMALVICSRPNFYSQYMTGTSL